MIAGGNGLAFAMAKQRVALVQVDPGEDKRENLETAFELIREAAASGAQALLLPESFHVRGPSELRFETSEPIPGELSQRLSDTARELGITLLAGSYNEAIDRPDKLYNTSLLFGPDGSLLGKYRKIHLFDVSIEGHVVARESSRNLPGEELVCAQTPLGSWGMTICYDLRFPELFRSLALMGAQVLVVPSNFAMHTGKDHWEPLLRARAIENGAWVLAPATVGSRGGFNSYGRSMAVDPWGTVVACASDEVGVTLVDIDLAQVESARQRIPSLLNRRPQVYRL